MPPPFRPTDDEANEPDAFVAKFPPAIQRLANEARACFRRALPGVQERVYLGWALLGYRVPAGRRTRYVGFVSPREDRVVVGFEHGVLLVDRFRFLTGDGSQVRELVLVPGAEEPPVHVVEELIRAAAELAIAEKGQRLERS